MRFTKFHLVALEAVARCKIYQTIFSTAPTGVRRSVMDALVKNDLVTPPDLALTGKPIGLYTITEAGRAMLKKHGVEEYQYDQNTADARRTAL